MKPDKPAPLLPPERVRRRYAVTLPPRDLVALDVLFALRAGMHGLETTLSRWLGSDALTPGRWQVLVVLWSADVPLAQRDIVTALKVTRATVSGLIGMLIAEGQVTTTVDPNDRRKVLVELTPNGRQMIERQVRENAAHLRKAFGALTDDELHRLVDLLARLLG